MTEPDGVKAQGGYRGGETRLVTASLNNPESGGVSFRGGGERCKALAVWRPRWYLLSC